MNPTLLPLLLVAWDLKVNDTGVGYGDDEVRDIAALGGFTHDIDSITLTEIGD